MRRLACGRCHGQWARMLQCQSLGAFVPQRWDSPFRQWASWVASGYDHKPQLGRRQPAGTPSLATALTSRRGSSQRGFWRHSFLWVASTAETARQGLMSQLLMALCHRAIHRVVPPFHPGIPGNPSEFNAPVMPYRSGSRFGRHLLCIGKAKSVMLLCRPGWNHS